MVGHDIQKSYIIGLVHALLYSNAAMRLLVWKDFVHLEHPSMFM